MAQLSPLLGTPSLHPRTSLCQMTFADWDWDWDSRDDEAGGTKESKDTNSDISSTKETKQDEASTVDNNTAAAPVVNAHAADDPTCNGSGSPPLLSILPLPKPLVVKAPSPSGCIPLDSNAAINYAAHAPWMPMLSIGDLPTADDDPMATLHQAISTHLAKLDQDGLRLAPNMMPSTTSLLTA